MHSNNLFVTTPLVQPSIVSVGAVVEYLRTRNAHGVVSMRFDRCAYVQCESHLFCVGLHSLGASSIIALLEDGIHTFPLVFKVGASVQLSKRVLTVDGCYSFDLVNATIYRAKIPCGLINQQGVLQHAVLLEQLEVPADGLAPLLQKPIDSIGTDDTALVQFTAPAINLLLKYINNSCGDESKSCSGMAVKLSRIQQLLGAGPGLTPSGDDFICGVFTALHFSDKPDIARSIWSLLCVDIVSRTTPVSIALLEQSALGASSERIDAFVAAIVNYPKVSAHHIQALLASIGHTSGWDWFTGFILCLQALENPINYQQRLGNSAAVA